MNESDINYGTHTIPQWDKSIPLSERTLANSFWTSGKKSIRTDDEYKARRRAKNARTAKNKEAKADANRERASRAGRR